MKVTIKVRFPPHIWCFTESMVLVKGCSKVVKGITRAQVISTTMMKFSLTNWTAVFRKLQIDKKNPIKSSVIRDFS